MRNDTSNLADRIVRKAVEAARVDRARSPQQSIATSVSSGSTLKGVDDDGNIFTIHPLFWDLDNWDDEGSVWL